VNEAARSQVMLAVEIMDTPLINSITAWLEYAKLIESPFFSVYPDLAICRRGTMTCGGAEERNRQESWRSTSRMRSE